MTFCFTRYCAAVRFSCASLLFFMPAVLAWAVAIPEQTLSPVIAYVTGLEGSQARLTRFLEQSPAFELRADHKYHLKAGAYFVFGGDAPDRFVGSLAVVEELVRLKRETPDRVALIMGNRDINKIRLTEELTDAALKRPPVWYQFIKEQDWIAQRGKTSRAARLQFILSKTMGAPQGFEARRQELAARAGGAPSAISDDQVVTSFRGELSPSGAFTQFLKLGSLVHRIGNTLFLHGGVNPQNFGFVPGHPARYRNVDQWIEHLNRWYSSEVARWDQNRATWSGRGPRPAEDLLNYPMAAIGQKFKVESVVCGRNVDDFNNPHLPRRCIIDALLAQGISRIVLGHTPTGDFPVVQRTLDDRFEAVSADNSYSSLESNAAAVHITGPDFGELRLGGMVHLPEQGGYVPAVAVTHIGMPTPFGKTVESAILIGSPEGRPDQIIGFRIGDRFRVTNTLMPLADIDSAKLAAPQGAAPMGRLQGPIGLFPVHFDPPTPDHKIIITELIEQLGLKKLFILVRLDGPEGHEASVTERMEMIKIMLRNAEGRIDPRIEIRGEPFHGQEAFFQALVRGSEGMVYAIAGEEDYEAMPSEVKSRRDRNWVVIPRPGTRHTTIDLPAETRAIELPVIDGFSSREAREYLHAGFLPEELPIWVDQWILDHNLYAVDLAPAPALQELEFLLLFDEFYGEMQTKMSLLPLLETIPRPLFLPSQSTGAWFETFILWSIRQNGLTEGDAMQFADAARHIFAAKGWGDRFPVVKSSSGVLSGQCLRALSGGM